MTVSRDVHILMAGGAADDAEAVRNLFTAPQELARVSFQHLDDFEQALPCLRGDAPRGKACPTSLLLVDVDHLPDQGESFLSGIKSDATLAHIPVVVLATQQTEAAVARAYDQGVNCCVAKPAKREALMEALRATNDFWLNVAKLPPE